MGTHLPSTNAEAAIDNASNRLSIDEGPVKAPGHADAALSFTLEKVVTYDEATSIRIRHTIDRNIIPWMSDTFAVQYFDKTLLSYASVMGLNGDLKLTSSECAWYSSPSASSGEGTGGPSPMF